jgi:polyisoprenoid-binding protein YceI
MTKKVLAVALFAPMPILAGMADRDSASSLSFPVGTAAAVEAVVPQNTTSRYVVAATGNEAQYRVQERIAGVDIPNYEAIGKTQAISGAIVFDQAGRLVPAQSKITIDVTGLKSDQERRDGFVQRRLLETERHPTVELVPTSLRGLEGPFPTSGTRTFQMVGNLTIRGVTRSTTWDVTARFDGGTVTGLAATRFTFADFEMEKPSVPVVLSLADMFNLEYSFTFTRAT